jgi:hypothetical protein
MKQTYVVLMVLLFLTSTVQAKSYSIAIVIFRDSRSHTLVSIYSRYGIEGGSKKNLSVEEASSIMRRVVGAHSLVNVAIRINNVLLEEYLPLLKAISENKWLQLIAIKTDAPDWLAESVWKEIQPATPPNSHMQRQ